MNTEIWKAVEGWETHYEISTLGRVRRIKDGMGTRFMRPVCGCITSHGYMKVTLTKNGKCYQKYVHRLIAQAFIPNPESKPYINHIDGVKNNNSITNLEWVTGRENLVHRSRVLGLEIGDKHHGSKLSSALIPAIRTNFKQGMSDIEIGKIYGVNRKTISAVRSKKCWFHVT